MFIKISDKFNFVYAERSIVSQKQGNLIFLDKNGESQYPIGLISCLFLGPGTKITHSAIRTASLNKCSLIWVGEDLVNCYSYIGNENRTTENFMKQLDLYNNHRSTVAYNFFKFRFKEYIKNPKTITQLMGVEGFLMKNIYSDFAKKYNIPWNKREKDGEWEKNSDINKAISVCNSVLYGITNSVLVALGYNSSLGFIHSGNSLSLVYDVADLYKIELCLPTAFELLSEKPYEIEKESRLRIKNKIKDINLMEKMVLDLEENLLYEPNYS